MSDNDLRVLIMHGHFRLANLLFFCGGWGGGGVLIFNFNFSCVSGRREAWKEEALACLCFNR